MSALASLSFMGALGWCSAILALGLVAFLVYINIRAQRLNRKIGSFSAAVQIGHEGKWYWGVGQYGGSSLLWYKLVALSPAPVFALPRYELDLSAARPHGTESDLVEVTICAGDQSWDMAMDPLTYNGLVSWVESSAPRSTHF